MQISTPDQQIGNGRHDCLSFPPLDCLGEAERDGGRGIGNYFALQFGMDLVIYDEEGMPTDLTLAEAIAFAGLEDAGRTAGQARDFMAQMRWARNSEQQARAGLEQTPATSGTSEQRAAWAWHIKILSHQGAVLAGLLARAAETVAAGFNAAADRTATAVAALPVRPAAHTGARALVSLALTPRILSQRPIAVCHARAGVTVV